MLWTVLNRSHSSVTQLSSNFLELYSYGLNMVIFRSQSGVVEPVSNLPSEERVCLASSVTLRWAELLPEAILNS